MSELYDTLPAEQTEPTPKPKWNLLDEEIPEFIDFAQHLQNKKVLERTIKEYIRDLLIFAGFCGSREKFLNAKKRNIEMFLSECVQVHSYSYVAQRRKIASLKRFYNWLTDVVEYRPDTPMKGFEMPRVDLERIPKAIPKKAMQSILSAESDSAKAFIRHRDNALFRLMYTTGIRRHEAHLLDIQSIDFKERRLLVHGKGNKWRWVPLDDESIALLKLYLNSRLPCVHNALFVSQKLERMSTSWMLKIFKKRLQKAGIDEKEFSLHDIRHTTATELARGDGETRGMDLTAVKNLLGHADITTTQLYVQSDFEHVQKEFNRVRGQA